jgi:hypothetical protein
VLEAANVVASSATLITFFIFFAPSVSALM